VVERCFDLVGILWRILQLFQTFNEFIFYLMWLSSKDNSSLFIFQFQILQIEQPLSHKFFSLTFWRTLNDEITYLFLHTT
jgi:hypothetical protein